MGALWEWIFLAMAATPVVAFVVLIWTIQEFRMAPRAERLQSLTPLRIHAFPAGVLAILILSWPWSGSGWIVMTGFFGMLLANLVFAAWFGWKAKELRGLTFTHGALSVLLSMWVLATPIMAGV
jgi:hypothetical protein